MPMISKMQARGLRIDPDHFLHMDKVLTQDMDQIIEEVHDLTGYYVNPGSGDQVADLLFKKLRLKQARPKLTISGDRESVENAILVAIQHDHPVVPHLLDYKELEKLRGTYVRPIPKLAVRVGHLNWRLFPNFRLTRVPSGRLACADPNLLAMPSRTARGRDIRKGFITDDGWVIVSIDESQIEVRIAAHRSQDPALIAVYMDEEDIYSDFAIAAFRLPDERYRPEGGKWKYPGVDSMEHRYPAKTCVLASIYDVTAMGLQEQMPVVCANCSKEATKHDCGNFSPLWDEDNCQTLIHAFYKRYPGLLMMRRIDHGYMRRHRMICDMWGRTQHITAVTSTLEWIVAAALREGSNLPMQGGAQGTIKLVMAEVDDFFNRFPELGEVGKFLLQVHDELLLECREDVADEIGEFIKSRFEACVPLLVPIKASVAKAKTWGDLDK
jgi:DNA polymerase-1